MLADDYAPERAGFVTRAMALLVDTLVLCALVGCLIFLFGTRDLSFGFPATEVAAASYGVPSDNPDIPRWARYCLLLIGLTYLFYTSTEIFFAGSPGKLFFNIQIADAHGRHASFSQLFLRWACKHVGGCLYMISMATALQSIYMLSFTMSFVMAVGFLMAIGVSRQALHDRIAATAVYPRDILRQRQIPLLFVKPRERPPANPQDLFKPRW